MEDIAAFMQQPEGPTPFESLGGMQALNQGLTGWINLDLSAGSYRAICFVPDPQSGKSHAELGMVMPFTAE